MNLSLFDIMDNISNALEERFTELADAGLKSKTTSSVSEYEDAIPHIYKFVCPITDRNESNFPRKCPSVTIEFVDSAENNGIVTISFVAHVAYYNPSTSDKETCEPVDDVDGEYYGFKTTSEYTSDNAYFNLYSGCLRLGMNVFNALQAFQNSSLFPIKGLKLDPPGLESFPYAECMVSFDVDLYRQKDISLNEKIRELL